jgi:hypothetical protein
MSSRLMTMLPRLMSQVIVPGGSGYGVCGTVGERDGVGLAEIEGDCEGEGDRDGVARGIGENVQKRAFAMKSDDSLTEKLEFP